jgi:hypothetical protein
MCRSRCWRNQSTQRLLLADYFKAIITGQNLPPDLDKESQGTKYY